MAYTQEGIMAQIWIAFGQGAGAIRVTQDAAMELRRWYFDAITPQIVDVEWETAAVQVLDRMRAIGSLAALKATQAGATAIVPQNVYDSARLVQDASDTPLCPPPPPPLSLRPAWKRAEILPPGAACPSAGGAQAGPGDLRVLRDV